MNEHSQPVEQLRRRCCVVGGGPAGMMLGLLLARVGVEVIVLEKHKDFLRDFRGDTIHPSTLELMHELGLLEEFLSRPHQQLRQIQAHFGSEKITIADFSHLPTHCKFIAFMPQWDFLNFISEHAHRYASFSLRMEAAVNDLLFENERVIGVRAATPQGIVEVRTDLVVGADGRSSTVRDLAGLEVVDLGAPIDVLWFGLSKRDGDPEQSFGYVGAGQFMVLLARGAYWQCGYVIRKGGFDETRERGLEKLRAHISRCVPFLNNRVEELKDWESVKLLTVKVDRLRQWCREGLLCIGDSAHAMSPVGGVGINLAIQDAVATANILGQALREGRVELNDVRAVQHRREWPAHLTQRVQIFMHEHFLERIFNAREQTTPPMPARLLERFAVLRRIPARMIGIGFRPEHVLAVNK
jgi:2-polyprenyl-6-methoxyphenol hydroxylase-like FAD-dependent oxidoreductase